MSVWQSQALRILLSFLILFLTLLPSSLLSLLDSPLEGDPTIITSHPSGLDSVTHFCSHLSLHNIDLFSPNPALLCLSYMDNAVLLSKGWAGCHSHPGPWSQRGRSKHPPHVWFLTRQKSLAFHFTVSLLNAKSQEMWD